MAILKRKRTSRKQLKALIGWREWIALPKLRVKEIKVKVDSGARTSAIHAEEIVHYKKGRRQMVRFTIYPLQRNRLKTVRAEAEILGHRKVRSSTGHETLRPVIVTPMVIGEKNRLIEVTLVDRDIMGFRMLLGREAFRDDFWVDAASSYLMGRQQKIKKKRK